MSVTNLPSQSPLGTWANQPFITDLQNIKELFDAKSEKRVRRTRFKTHYWEAYSPRLDRRVGLYRDIGHDHWAFVESDPTVPWFTERPKRIRLHLGHRRLSRPFDMVLQRNGVFECHRLWDEEADISQAEAENVASEREICEAWRVCYRRISRQEIERHRQLIDNWKRMLPYIRGPRHRLDARVLGYVSAVGSLTLGEIDVLLADIEQSDARAAVFGLLHQGLLVAPELSHEPLSPTTTVRTHHEN